MDYGHASCSPQDIQPELSLTDEDKIYWKVKVFGSTTTNRQREPSQSGKKTYPPYREVHIHVNKPKRKLTSHPHPLYSSGIKHVIINNPILSKIYVDNGEGRVVLGSRNSKCPPSMWQKRNIGKPSGRLLFSVYPRALLLVCTYCVCNYLPFSFLREPRWRSG